MVATNDSHYLNHEDADLHDTILCIGTRALKAQERRMRFINDQFYVKTPAEMAASVGAKVVIKTCGSPPAVLKNTK